MKRSLNISVAFNVLLLVLLTCPALTVPRPKASAAGSWPRSVPVVTATHQDIPASAESPLAVVEADEPFTWAQIESADYRVYLANLRAVCCPEITARDIIVADVNELFALRVKALVDEVSGRYWNLLLRKDDMEQVVEEKHSQLRALAAGRDEAFLALFGDSDPRSEEDQQQSDENRRQQWTEIADFLPDDKRARFVADKTEWEREWAGIVNTPGLTAAQQQAKRRELENAHDLALREWLTPDEFDELRLRQPSVASVRNQTPGLDLSDDEVRAVAKICLAAKESDGTQQPVQTEAQLRELLGPERFAAWQRTTDDRYANFQRVAQRLDLPEATAGQAFDIRRQAEDAARQVLAGNFQSADDHRLVLQAIADETRRDILVTLGPEAFTAYDRLDGGWLKALAGPAH